MTKKYTTGNITFYENEKKKGNFLYITNGELSTMTSKILAELPT